MTSWKHKVIIFTDRHSNIINQSNDDDNNSEIKVVDITAVEITGAAQTDAPTIPIDVLHIQQNAHRKRR